MNNLVLAGRLTADPEIRTTATGTEVLSFCLAVDRHFKNQDGEREVDFINCVAWRQTATFIGGYFRKGDGLTLNGRIATRKYIDKDGNNRVVYEAVVEDVEFPLGKAKEKLPN